MSNTEVKLQKQVEELKKEIYKLRKTVVTQEMERNDLFKRFAKVEAELENYRMQEFNHKMFKK